MVRAHGLTFIGPPPEVLERFASKEGTRRLLAAHGLPTIPGSEGMLARRPARPRRGRAHRLPGAHQALGRRRWQGHAHGPLAARARSRRSRSAAPRRGPPSVTTRSTSRSGSRTPPRRGPGRRRPLRPRRPSRRARLLRPAPPPEDPRGGARRRRCPTTARADLRRARRSGRSSRPATRTSGTLEFLVDALGQRLLHRDQLPDPGGASGDRDADRHRPRGRPRSGSPPASRWASPRRDVTFRGHAIEFRINAEDADARLPAAGRHRRALPRARRPGRPAWTTPPVRRLRGPALLRLAARQARRLGPGPREPPSRARGPRSTRSSSTASSPTCPSTGRSCGSEPFLEGRMTTNLLDRVGSAAFLAAAGRASCDPRRSACTPACTVAHARARATLTATSQTTRSRTPRRPALRDVRPSHRRSTGVHTTARDRGADPASLAVPARRPDRRVRPRGAADRRAQGR